MDYIRQAGTAVQEWYARDDNNKEFTYYGFLFLWVALQLINTSLVAHIASLPNNTVTFLFFVLFWYFPTLLASTYALLHSMRLFAMRVPQHQLMMSREVGVTDDGRGGGV